MRRLVLALLTLASIAANATTEGNVRDPAVASLSIELGGGAWLGDFRDHLDRDGAYLATPTLDFVARFPFNEYAGIEAIIGSACVIHPYSEPIDGSFIYQEAGLYAGITLGRSFAWISAEAGFEHGTLLVTQYSSGVAGAALGIRAPIRDRLLWTATIRFRRGFLQAVTIPDFYSTDIIDNPTSLTISAGVAYGF